MLNLLKMFFIGLTFLIINHEVIAGPWFTGPLLAPAGHTIPKGHTNLEIYGLDILTNGSYDGFGTLLHSTTFRSVVVNPIITHGFTEWLDVQFNAPYVFNSNRGAHYNRLGDVALALGIQLVEQNNSPKKMDVRILVQETLPTGRYDHLNPAKYGTDSTGLGSYHTQFGLDFQYLWQVFQTHYLRTRLILTKLYTGSTYVSGKNSYGGTIATSGRIKDGGENGIDLAFEYTLTQNWVAVMEGTITDGQATRFNGILTIGQIGGPDASIGNDVYKVKALAPALEYNFNGNLGLIGGIWFPVSGKNTSHFTTYVLAINAYW